MLIIGEAIRSTIHMTTFKIIVESNSLSAYSSYFGQSPTSKLIRTLVEKIERLTKSFKNT